MPFGIDKLNFLNTPTPLEKLENISKDLKINLYAKRDDLTNYGTGGNKLRKLEYLMKDALDKEATMVITVGGVQTNHGRLTATMAAKYGLKSAIVAVDDYPGELSANLLLDGILGCHVYLVKPQPGVSNENLMYDTVTRIAKDWEDKGERVYFIPLGGTNELGILGYYDCALEIADQVQEMELDHVHIVSTIGSMGTYMGLAAAIANEDLPFRLTGITIMHYKDPKAHAARAYKKIQKAYNLEKDMAPEDFRIVTDYEFGAYNNAVKEVREAIYYMARKEGIFLDPCYTGKTFYGIKDMAEKIKISPEENMIFLHTGGIPGLNTPHHRKAMEEELIDYIHII